MKKLLLTTSIFLFAAASFANLVKEHRVSLRGGIAASSISWVGPLTTANFKLSAGADYWLTENWFLGGDIGLGGEGYGKVIGVTQASIVNLKTGAFMMDPGITFGYAFNPLGHFTLYSSVRFGFPLRSGYPGALSLGPTIGSLVEITNNVALDLAINANVVANFKFNYLATILSLGSIGIRVYL